MKAAVLVDIAGKQNYIFSSNKLRDIAGASEIIRRVTDKDYIKEKMSLDKIDGNFGGGNALIFFDNEKEAKEFINRYSKFLLKNYPSLVVYFGLNPVFEESNFKESNSKTHQILEDIKNSFYPLSQGLSLGLEELCPNSDFPATGKFDELRNSHISKATYIKQKMADDSNKNFSKLLSEVLGDYKFSTELDKIIHNDKSFIAVGHIDANDLGKKVKNLKTRDDYKEFSKNIDNGMQIALKETVRKLIENLDKFSFADIKNLEIKDKILPFRPIVLSGDDFTFVSEGRLGVWIAKTFINELSRIKFGKENEPLYASGGVAIVKGKTPFFRAYEIAEELATSAKKITRKDEKIKTSLDFIITSSNILGDLDFLREKYYTRNDTKLFNEGFSDDDFNKLLNLMNDLKQISKTKIMKLRDLLLQSRENTQKYLEIYCDSKLLNNGEIENEKMLLEAIELLNFYPLLGEKYDKIS
ncbi:hypothetical protein F1B92_06855 [Campylobacter sp. FMV-PI01]|uniref:Cas10/Cmr2 second palm domain-containing protein n=1 Tax=Campylobacter portucalensis TaxID=2608384 RepID=A0A6L5WIM1_9BACT|nr:hypothetical protein [Campylobacter portucalensis]MSN96884.1 hypothetical protein [Campylobacter portucalensis]